MKKHSNILNEKTMKKEYTKPATTQISMISASCLLTASFGGQEKEGEADIRVKRNDWDNIWSN